MSASWPNCCGMKRSGTSGLRSIFVAVIDGELTVRTFWPLTGRIVASVPGLAASCIAERRQMMQAWADYLDQLKADTEARPIHPSA